MLFAIMVGATITYLSQGEPEIATIIIGVLLVIIMFLRRPGFIERLVKSRSNIPIKPNSRYSRRVPLTN